jgi:hypothetical protein
MGVKVSRIEARCDRLGEPGLGFDAEEAARLRGAVRLETERASAWQNHLMPIFNSSIYQVIDPP